MCFVRVKYIKNYPPPPKRGGGCKRSFISRTITQSVL